MTTGDIRKRIAEESDARFGETVEILIGLLRHQHRHHAYEGECYCEMCQHIRGEYVNSKLSLHRIKRRIDRIDYQGGPDWELTIWDQERAKLFFAMTRVWQSKEYQKGLTKNVL